MIEFHDNSDGHPTDPKKTKVFEFVIKTDAENEYKFVETFSELLVKTIDTLYRNNGDSKSQRKAINFPYLLNNFVDMVCSYRKYKTGVLEKTIKISNNFMPNTKPVMQIDNAGDYISPAERIPAEEIFGSEIEPDTESDADKKKE